MYNANDLDQRLMNVFRGRYPNFRSMRFIFAGEPGSGKSTLLASVPVSEGKKRIVFDLEDSMAYLDAGPEGVDVYTPRRQQFAMNRVVYPTLEDLAKYYQGIKKDPARVGAVTIDNLAVFQDLVKSWLDEHVMVPNDVRVMWRKFDAESDLVNNGLIGTWVRNQDGNYWKAMKAVCKSFLMTCARNQIHFLASTEESNVWVNYGKKDAKIIGKKAKIWDIWYRYTDGVIALKREVNTTNPPNGELYPNQPKMRLQGMNPRWLMDWNGFADELEAAAQRTEADIPKECQVEEMEVFEEA